jgi:hypothetical protein
MVVFGKTTVIQSRDLVVERIDAGIEIGCGKAGFERLSRDGLMRASENRFGV